MYIYIVSCSESDSDSFQSIPYVIEFCAIVYWIGGNGKERMGGDESCVCYFVLL